MGITGLWPFIKEKCAGRLGCIARTDLKLLGQLYTDQPVPYGFDTPGFVHTWKKIYNDTGHLEQLSMLLQDCQKNNIKPVFVFDGKEHAKAKEEEHRIRQTAKRHQHEQLDNCQQTLKRLKTVGGYVAEQPIEDQVNMNELDEEEKKEIKEIQQFQESCKRKFRNLDTTTAETMQDCMNFLKKLGATVIEAPGEGEAYLAILNRKGYIKGIFSEDSDLAGGWGALTVIRNGTSRLAREQELEIYQIETILQQMKMTRNQMIKFSVLAGCDFNKKKRIEGIGVKTAKILARMDDTKDMKSIIRSSLFQAKKRNHLKKKQIDISDKDLIKMYEEWYSIFAKVADGDVSEEDHALLIHDGFQPTLNWKCRDCNTEHPQSQDYCTECEKIAGIDGYKESKMTEEKTSKTDKLETIQEVLDRLMEPYHDEKLKEF